jgi:hypothetical protein
MLPFSLISNSSDELEFEDDESWIISKQRPLWESVEIAMDEPKTTFFCPLKFELRSCTLD